MKKDRSCLPMFKKRETDEVSKKVRSVRSVAKTMLKACGEDSETSHNEYFLCCLYGAFWQCEAKGSVGKMCRLRSLSHQTCTAGLTTLTCHYPDSD